MKYICLLSLLVLVLLSCSLTDGFDEEPMYLNISEASFESILSDTPSSQISDVWAFADGQNIGIYELPARVPVLGDGEVVIDLLPGIRNNGQANSARDYPFYERTKLTLPFEANEVVDIPFESSYLEDVKFAFNENFEGTNIFTYDLDEDGVSVIELSEEAIYGRFCGKINVNSQLANFEQATETIFLTEDFGLSQVYLEIDYRSDVNFIVGYEGYDGVFRESIGVITLFPSEEWNKLYLDLSADLNGGQYDGYQIIIGGSGLAETGTIWLDNIRIVHL